eukprot:361262_1
MSQVKGKCSNCGNTERTKKCSGCKQVWYCNTDCQKKNWMKHKKQCKKLTQKNQNDSKAKGKDNHKKSEAKNWIWQCQICGFHNNINTKICMVCDQLQVKITAKNTRPKNIVS